LTALEDEPEQWVLLALPAGITCSTAEMYGKLDASPRSLEREETGNDFEAVTPVECIELVCHLRVLGCVKAGLTGSGAAVFGYFKSEVLAREAAGSLPAGTWCKVVPTLTRISSLLVGEPKR
jgi:4-diphosphocytidyl-2C-methyl-D-erythritol kinase